MYLLMCFIQHYLTTNSYVFYEVANSYEFVRPHSYDLVAICLNPSDG